MTFLGDNMLIDSCCIGFSLVTSILSLLTSMKVGPPPCEDLFPYGKSVSMTESLFFVNSPISLSELIP